VGRLASAYRRAVAAHREAVAHAQAARPALGASPAVPPSLAGPSSAVPPPALPPSPGPAGATLPEVVEGLGRAAARLAPGWLGDDLTRGSTPARRTGDPAVPVHVRAGTAEPLPGLAFPALVPVLGGNHLAIDAEARDPRVAALLRSLVVRLLGAFPAGTLRVLAADPMALGATFHPLRPLVAAGALSRAASTEDEVRHLLDDAERHVRSGEESDGWLLVVVTSLPRVDLARFVALTHAGPAGRVCVVLAGYPLTSPGAPPPPLGAATLVRRDGDQAWFSDPPGEPFSADGRGLAAPVTLDGDPSSTVVEALAADLAGRLRREAALSFADLVPPVRWTESSVDGLRTVVGRAGRTPVKLAFDDATPHWLVGGRTGAGKTVFLLDVLYGLAARYPPGELALYLLDFKEGVSFTEFSPTVRDPSWIPHARSVGTESDREYGVAVLRELRRQMNSRAAAFKRQGVARLADLRRARPDLAMPRVVAVVDEFQALLHGNDALAREATGLLEEVARKGRSYGIHLVLASQTVSGIEALFGKTESIFGQFPLRVALPGGSGVLDPTNTAADGLPLGSAIVNASAGLAVANVTVRFPDAHASAAEVTGLRHQLWAARDAGARPPAVFAGYATQHVEDDPTFRGLAPGARRPLALVGRVVDVDLTTAYFAIDGTPGRHLAVVGTDPAGADVLHAAALSLARQHLPGAARFLVAPLVAAADEVAAETVAALTATGQPVTTVDIAAFADELRKLADPATTRAESRTYLVVYGVDGASAALGLRDPQTFRAGLDDLQAVLRQGPGYGVHLLGWWRGLRRLSDDIGGSANREDMACLVALNVPAGELSLYLGQHDLSYTPRPNRALLVDRHDQRVRLIVPYLRPGRSLDEEASR
jgi:DNA segregation ATPase FtsK/SpoIIIE, S-DNA-T family